jgi:hypothetical protein
MAMSQLPMRCGTRPEMLCSRKASPIIELMTSVEERSMFWPSPVRCLWWSAARTAKADIAPTRRSTEPLSIIGGSSGWPV